ncbi:MAG: hypothetical protein IPK01_08045 [Acidobacteria bacterium]|nr:hypothetical protein [Acidobacteriota bacterium]
MNSKPHSKLGIFSCIIAFAVWFYFAAAFYLIFYVDGFTQKLTDTLIPESRGMTDLTGMGIAVVLFTFIFFFIPAGGHFIGALAGSIGIFRSGTRRLFPFAGIVLNVLPIAVLFFFWMIGSFAPSN